MKISHPEINLPGHAWGHARQNKFIKFKRLQIMEHREDYIYSMSEKYKFHDSDALYFVTSTIVNWIHLFSKKEYCDILLETIKTSQRQQELIVHSWCIMPSHFHMIISSKNSLSVIMKTIKSVSNRKIIAELEKVNNDWNSRLLYIFKTEGFDLKRIKNYKVWQDGNHPVLLDSNEMLEQRVDYIHDNPVKSELVNSPEEYIYSSAIDYCGGRGLLELNLIEW